MACKTCLQKRCKCAELVRMTEELKKYNEQRKANNQQQDLAKDRNADQQDRGRYSHDEL
jgi:hypothetical protein